LAKRDEISSTEKLLNLIRSNKDPETVPADQPPQPAPVTPSNPFGANVFAFGKNVTIGVDVGYHDLKLVKTVQASDKKYQLLDYRTVPFETGVGMDSPRFVSFLKTALTNFRGSTKKYAVWASMSSARVETRCLRIPKVPKKQVSNAVFWTFKKEVPYNDESDLFDFDILDEIADNGVQKIEVMAYIAPKTEIQRMNELFHKAGFHLAGISIVPFAFQNLMRTIMPSADGKDVCSLFVGRNWSRIAIYSKGNLILSRGIKAGIRSMIETIREGMLTKYSTTTVNLSYTDEIKTSSGLEKASPIGLDQARQTFYSLIQGSIDPSASQTEIELDEEEAFEMIAPALERLVRQVERTLSHYQLKFNNEEIGKLYISGQIAGYRRMISYIGKQIGLPTDVIDPFGEDNYFLGGLPVPSKIAERESYAPAIGISLSHNTLTPNFIYTYKDKETTESQRSVNRSLFAALLFVMALCCWAYLWQDNHIEEKKATLTLLQQKIETQVPLVDKNLVVQRIGRMKHIRADIVSLRKRHLSMAIISELSSKTPEEVRLLEVSANMGDNQGNVGPNKKRVLSLNGIIFGNRLTYESMLAGYLLNLKKSPMLDRPVINKKSFEYIEDKEVLRFQAQLDLI